MTSYLPAIAAFAAFCVWLGVRFYNRRERWAKWTLALVVGLPVLYVASVGPACWMCSRANVGASAVSTIYRPLTHVTSRSEWSRYIVSWYSELGAAADWMWIGDTWPPDEFGMEQFFYPANTGTQVFILDAEGWLTKARGKLRRDCFENAGPYLRRTAVAVGG